MALGFPVQATVTGSGGGKVVYTGFKASRPAASGFDVGDKAIGNDDPAALEESFVLAGDTWSEWVAAPTSAAAVATVAATASQAVSAAATADGKAVVADGKAVGAQTDADTANAAIAGLGALASRDDITVSLISDPQNLPSSGGITVNDWTVATTPATGVSAMANVHRLSNTGTSVIAPIDPFALTTAPNWDNFSGTTNVVIGNTGFASGDGLYIAPDLFANGLPAVRTGRAGSAYTGIPLVDPATSEEIPAGSTLEVAVANLQMQTAGDDLRLVLVLNPNQVASPNNQGRVYLDPTNGTASTDKWDALLAPIIAEPDINDYTITDGGGGIYGVRLQLPVLQTIEAGWFLYVMARAADVWIKVGNADVGVGTAGSLSVVSESEGWAVTDPAVGTHRQAAPIAIAATAAKVPYSLYGALEISGDNSNGAEAFRGRVNILPTEQVQLWLTEDGNTTSLTMTLPASAWSAAQEMALAIVEYRGGTKAIVLAINGVVVTGIVLALDVTGIEAYRTRLTAATQAWDAVGVPDLLDGGERASMVAAEITAAETRAGSLPLKFYRLGAS